MEQEQALLAFVIFLAVVAVLVVIRRDRNKNKAKPTIVEPVTVEEKEEFEALEELGKKKPRRKEKKPHVTGAANKVRIQAAKKKAAKKVAANKKNAPKKEQKRGK